MMESKKCQWTHRSEIREPSMGAQGISRGLETKDMDLQGKPDNGTKDISFSYFAVEF